MNALPRVNKVMVSTIRTAAGIASGTGEYGLANRLWKYEAQLRSRQEPVVDVLTQLREEFMAEYLSLATYGFEKSPTKNGYLRGLRRALELIGGPVPTFDEALEFDNNQQEAAFRAAMTDEDGTFTPFGHGGLTVREVDDVLAAAGRLYRRVEASSLNTEDRAALAKAAAIAESGSSEADPFVG